MFRNWTVLHLIESFSATRNHPYRRFVDNTRKLSFKFTPSKNFLASLYFYDILSFTRLWLSYSWAVNGKICTYISVTFNIYIHILKGIFINLTFRKRSIIFFRFFNLSLFKQNLAFSSGCTVCIPTKLCSIKAASDNRESTLCFVPFLITNGTLAFYYYIAEWCIANI